MDIKKIKFKNLLFIILKYNMIFDLLVIIISLTTIIFLRSANTAIMLSVIYFLGYIMSASLHEYMHIVCMRRAGIQQIRLENNLWKFSIITDEKVQGKVLIAIALSGPLMCFVIGIVLIFIGRIWRVDLMLICSALYLIQIVNVIPPFGDGIMIIKGVLT